MNGILMASRSTADGRLATRTALLLLLLAILILFVVFVFPTLALFIELS